MPIALPSPQVLEITGADAVTFAHAQFASDVRALANRQWHWSAWLSAQGRVRALFRAVRLGDEHLLLILQGGTAETLRDALAPFVFRAKVQFRVVGSFYAIGFDRPEQVLDYLGGVPGAADAIVADGRIGVALPGAQPRWYVLGDALPAMVDDSPASLNRWNTADVAAGIVEVGDAQADRFLPSWLGLDELGAVSVRKGCYPGQEIVARLHFKGGNKRWLHQLAFSAQDMPEPGTVLATAGRDAGTDGELIRAAWTEAGQGLALATLPKLTAGTALIAPAMPDASFRVVSTIGNPND